MISPNHLVLFLRTRLLSFFMKQLWRDPTSLTELWVLIMSLFHIRVVFRKASVDTEFHIIGLWLLGQVQLSQFVFRRFLPSLTWRERKSCDNDAAMSNYFSILQKDFLSIELVHGRVKVTVDLGSGPLALVTDRRYNNGSWYKIAFQRNRKQGMCPAGWMGCWLAS